MWLADVQRFADLPYVLVHDPATVIDNVDVDRIMHLRIGASGIHLKHSLVLAAFGVGELLRELIFLLILCGFFLGTALASLPSMLILVPCRCLSLATAFLLKEPDGHVVYLLFSDTVADRHEQGRVEYWPVRQFCQAAQVLHIRVLADYLYRLLVREAKLVLDNHCADYHTGRLVAGTFEVVVQTGVVYLLQLRPRKSVAKYNPAVVLVQIVKGRPEQIQRQLLVLVLRCILHSLLLLTLQRYKFYVKTSNKYTTNLLLINEL